MKILQGTEFWEIVYPTTLFGHGRLLAILHFPYSRRFLAWMCVYLHHLTATVPTVIYFKAVGN